jgi:hypothetical protein
MAIVVVTAARSVEKRLRWLGELFSNDEPVRVMVPDNR